MTTAVQATKRRRSRLVEKYLVTPIMRPIIRMLPGTFALLETTGRRT